MKWSEFKEKVEAALAKEGATDADIDWIDLSTDISHSDVRIDLQYLVGEKQPYMQIWM